ncbi:MAG TPA: isochorismatase family cysteine hydrolase [Sandaracinaceae bacterium LLY-WYZ-13_1]|nr:isochorismatase family cysteine hydrolase [Sandaracinaceae bacterium LLY-WYZ-13_1]
MTGDRGRTALLLVDLVHPFDFEGAEVLAERARRLVSPLSDLVARARALAIPVLYVNDHFGRWRASFHQLVERAADGPGRPLVEALRPDESDYFVLKPHRSGFYCTPLELLLSDLGRDRLVIVGLTTDMCVLSTVNDARTRRLHTVVPEDGCEALSDRRHERALELMELSFDTRVTRCGALFG